jgi:hypothetical protein
LKDPFNSTNSRIYVMEETFHILTA